MLEFYIAKKWTDTKTATEILLCRKNHTWLHLNDLLLSLELHVAHT
jgi:hypothetical protein